MMTVSEEIKPREFKQNTATFFCECVCWLYIILTKLLLSLTNTHTVNLYSDADDASFFILTENG